MAKKKSYTVETVEKLTPYKIDRMSDAEVIKAYNDIRVAVSKRLAALDRSGYIKKHPKFVAPETRSITQLAADVGIVKPGKKVIGEKGVVGEALEDPEKAEALVLKTNLRENLLDISQYLKTGPSASKLRAGYVKRREAIGGMLGLSDAQFRRMDAFFDAVREYAKEQGFRVGSDEILEYWQDMVKMQKVSRVASSKKTIQEAYNVWSSNAARFARTLSTYEEDIAEKKRLEGLKKAGVISEDEMQQLRELKRKHSEDVKTKKELSELLDIYLPAKRKQKMTPKRAVKKVKKAVKTAMKKKR